MSEAKKNIQKACCVILCLVLSVFSAAYSMGDSEYGYSVKDADVFIEVPTLRQYGDYSCGTTCVQMVMNYLYPYDYDLNLTQYETDLKTDKQEGTSGENIKAYFDANGVDYREKDEITAAELTEYLDEKKVVLMCIQAWSAADDGSYNLDTPEKDDYIVEGHWVICVGYKKGEDSTLFYFNDPACVGHCVMEEEDLNNRWIDMDAQGNIYKHYGLIITGTGNYSPDGAYYLY